MPCENLKKTNMSVTQTCVLDSCKLPYDWTSVRPTKNGSHGRSLPVLGYLGSLQVWDSWCGGQRFKSKTRTRTSGLLLSHLLRRHLSQRSPLSHLNLQRHLHLPLQCLRPPLRLHHKPRHPRVPLLRSQRRPRRVGHVLPLLLPFSRLW
jgi:hypothetical protein